MTRVIIKLINERKNTLIINGHVYNRGSRLDYDLWAQMGNRGWGYASVLPYFKRSERRVGPGDSTFRGQEGEFAVTDLDWRDPLCEAFIDGDMHTGFLEEHPYLLENDTDSWLEEIAVIAASVAHFRRVEAASARGDDKGGGKPHSNWKWHGTGGWKR